MKYILLTETIEFNPNPFDYQEEKAGLSILPLEVSYEPRDIQNTRRKATN